MPEGDLENDPDHLPEGYEWLTREEVAELDGVSERTVTSRISNGYYRSIVKDKRRFVAYKRKTAGSLKEGIPELDGSPSGIDPDKLQKLMEMVLEAGARNQEMVDRLLESESGRLKAEAETERKAAELMIMNNERANANTALQRANDDRRDNASLRAEVEALRRENDALKAQKSQGFKWPWLK
jgi:hypothetical protein